MKGMATSSGSKGRFGLLCVLAFAAMAGCQENSAGYGAISATTPQKPELDLSAPQGVPVVQSAPVDAVKLAATRPIGARSNPFALTPEESAFNQSQTGERVLAGFGGYALEITPTMDDPEDAPPVIEPVPNWRLSGVLIGQGVMALLDTGAVTYEIRPGMMVPGTEWRVVSIDADRALLAREGNRLPKEFYVGLSGPITGDGVTVAGGGGGAPGGGAPGGGAGGGRGGGRAGG